MMGKRVFKTAGRLNTDWLDVWTREAETNNLDGDCRPPPLCCVRVERSREFQTRNRLRRFSKEGSRRVSRPSMRGKLVVSEHGAR